MRAVVYQKVRGTLTKREAREYFDLARGPVPDRVPLSRFLDRPSPVSV